MPDPHRTPPSDTSNFLLISFTIAPKLGTQYLITFLNMSQLFFRRKFYCVYQNENGPLVTFCRLFEWSEFEHLPNVTQRVASISMARLSQAVSWKLYPFNPSRPSSKRNSVHTFITLILIRACVYFIQLKLRHYLSVRPTLRHWQFSARHDTTTVS